jgi:hypothetical protein
MTIEVEWARTTAPELKRLAAQGDALAILPVGSPEQGTHPASAVLSDAWHFAKRVTLGLALRSAAPRFRPTWLPSQGAGCNVTSQRRRQNKSTPRTGRPRR